MIKAINFNNHKTKNNKNIKATDRTTFQATHDLI